MIDIKKYNLNARSDLLSILNLIHEEASVLDLGCGNGDFLHLLSKEKNVKGLGVEISQDKIIQCVANGVNVIQGNLNEGLNNFTDNSFDFVILGQTLQAVKRPDILLQEMLRVGDKIIISLINMGQYKSRLQLMWSGLMPVTKTLPHQWYDTPNIHLSTINDFKNLCKKLDIKIINEIPIGFPVLSSLCPNLFATTMVLVITNKK